MVRAGRHTVPLLLLVISVVCLAVAADRQREQHLRSCSTWYGDVKDSLPRPPRQWRNANEPENEQTAKADKSRSDAWRVYELTRVPGRHETTPDVDADAWCSEAEYHHWAAQEEGTTAEVVAVVTTPLITSVCGLVESAIRMGYNVTLVTTPKEQFSLPMKQVLTTLFGKLFVKQYQPQRQTAGQQHLVVGVDAFDVLVQLPARNLHSKMRAMWPDALPPLVMSAEANLYPLPDPWAFPDYGRELFPFPNSGGWIARGDTMDYLTEFVEFVAFTNFAVCAFAPTDDQCKVLAGILERKFPFPVDTRALLFQSMYSGRGSGIDYEAASFFDFTDQGLLRRRDVANTPAFLHWNGITKYDYWFGNSAMVPFKRGNYLQNGWMRRPLLDGTLPMRSFHVDPDLLGRHLTMYHYTNTTLRLDLVSDGVTQVMDLCFGR